MAQHIYLKGSIELLHGVLSWKPSCNAYSFSEHTVRVRSDRKLCFVVQNSLARGPAARPRCIPPASGSFRALNPFQSHRSYRRSSTRGRLRSPCTHRSFQDDHGAIAPLGTSRRAWRSASPPAPNHAQTAARSITNQGSVPAPTDTPMTISWRPTFRSLDARHVMETTSSRPGREHFIAALALEPSHRPWSVSPPP